MIEKQGHPALYASKEMLHWVCIDPVNILTDAEDKRKVVAYVVTMSDWHRIENWYVERGDIVMLKRQGQKPVLARSDNLLREAGNLIKWPYCLFRTEYIT